MSRSPTSPALNPNAAGRLLNVDVVILGAGTAGLAAYHSALAVTDRVLLIEGGPLGTTCARVGCMPSKLLIAAAGAASAVERAHLFGVGEPCRARVDGRRVMERVQRERDRFVGLILDSLEQIPRRHWLSGHARFRDATTLVVSGIEEGQGEVVVRARAVVIATGARAVVPSMFDELGDRLVVSDDVFDWHRLPASVAVFGSGLVGLELGQALSRLGVRVRVFGRGGSLGPLTDPEVGEAASRALGDLPRDLDARVAFVRRDGDQVAVRFSDGGQAITERFEYALVATGRVPNVDRLGLETTGLAVDKRGVPIFDRGTLRCGESSIFLAGDAAADVPVLHEANDEGVIAGLNAARFPEVKQWLRRSPITILFTDPQIAMVGETWAAVQHREPVVGKASFEDQGRSRIMLVNRGRLHLYVERTTGRLLGAEMVGPEAEHLAHLLAWAHQLGLSVERMLTLPFYHPVIEEGLRTALRDAAAQLSLPGVNAEPPESARDIAPAN